MKMDLVLLRFSLMFNALDVDCSTSLELLDIKKVIFVALDVDAFISFELLNS